MPTDTPWTGYPPDPTTDGWHCMIAEADFSGARSRADKVLRENNILRPPVLPREIAESNGLTLKVVDFSVETNDVAGFIDFEELAIYVNAADPFNRQTFTIAHELGHYFLHRAKFATHPDEYKVLLRKPIGQETDPIEREANAFAAELLVPRKYLELYGKYANVDELADLFAVSRDVIRYRIKFVKLAQTR